MAMNQGLSSLLERILAQDFFWRGNSLHLLRLVMVSAIFALNLPSTFQP